MSENIFTVNRIGSIIKQFHLDSDFMIYKNGTVILKNDEDTNVTLTEKTQLDEEIFLYHANTDNVIFIYFKDIDQVEANQLFKEDRESNAVIFDSSKDDISNYGIAMYVFVNKELNMGHGKVAGQVGHCVQKMIEFTYENKNEPNYKDMITKFKFWKDHGNVAKIVCKVDSDTFKELVSMPNAFTIIDAGLTQIPSGSMTVVGFLPNFKKENPDIFNKQKLY
jgi:peptidyl-tRNA hydrolase